MLWYVIVFLVCLLLYILHTNAKNTKTKRILEILSLILLIFFSGTRYRLGGYDYGIYEKIYNQAPTINNFSFNLLNVYGSDILYLFLNSLIKTIGFNFYGFTLIESIIFYILLYKGLKKYNISFGFFIIVFLYKLCIFNTFVSMRQSLVLVIFLNSISYIIENKKLKYIFIMILCTLIHTSSIVLIPLIFIRNLRFSRKMLILYCSSFFILFLLNVLGIFKFNPIEILNSIFSNNDIIMGKVESYFVKFTEINILSTIENYLICVFLIIYYNNIYNSCSKEQRIFINLFLLIIPIVTFLRSIEVMIRLRDYFSILMPFVLYYICNNFKGKDKLLIITFITILCFIGYYRYIINYGGLTPYKSYITENISILR